MVKDLRDELYRRYGERYGKYADPDFEDDRGLVESDEVIELGKVKRVPLDEVF